MQTRTMIFAPAFLMVVFSTCTSGQEPRVIRKTSLSSAHTLIAPWALDSLQPDEKRPLIEGQITPISIYMAASGDGDYLLELSANRKHFRPFTLRMVRGVGEADFAGYITWFLKVNGKTEKVTLTLYSIHRILGYVDHMTILKQIERTYDVECNRKQNKFILFLKSFFRLCRCN